MVQAICYESSQNKYSARRIRFADKRCEVSTLCVIVIVWCRCSCDKLDRLLALQAVLSRRNRLKYRPKCILDFLDSPIRTFSDVCDATLMSLVSRIYCLHRPLLPSISCCHSKLEHPSFYRYLKLSPEAIPRFTVETRSQISHRATMGSQKTTFHRLVGCIVITSLLAGFCSAFSPTDPGAAIRRGQIAGRPILTVLQAEESNEAPEKPDEGGSQPLTPPPPVPPKRLDPLMASLTRMDPETASGPTRNIPVFGEVPVDGSLVVLVPAAVIAFLGFVLSIVVAANSADQIADSLNQVVDDIAQQASAKTNMVYDESVCRGICSSQSEDLDGLRNFMEGLKK